MSDPFKSLVPVQTDRPSFQPEPPKAVPGVDPGPPLDAKAQSIVNYFSVMGQEIQWVGRQMVAINTNVMVLADILRDLLAKQEVHDKQLKDMEGKPMKTFWEIVKWVTVTASAAYLTHLIEGKK